MYAAHRPAFTLIEMVIVLVVLAVLAALAVPTFETLVTNSRDRTAELTLEAVATQAQANALLRTGGVVAYTRDDFADVTAEAFALAAGAASGLSAATAVTLVADGAESTAYGELSVAVDGDDPSRVGLAMRSSSGRCARGVLDAVAIDPTVVSLAAGERCAAEVALVAGQAPPPAAPAAVGGDRSVTVSFEAVEFPYVTGYRLEAGGDIVESWPHTPAASFTATVAGLTPGVSYTFTVVAYNSHGESTATATATPTGPPAAPEVTATASPGTVSLTWGEPADNGAPVTGYTVEQAPSGEGPWSVIATQEGTAVAAAELTNGTTYWFRVAAENTYGLGPWSEPVAATPTTTPAAPAEIAANPGTGASFGTVTVYWAPPVSDGGAAVTAYDLEYATSSTFAGATTLTGVTSPRQVTGLSGNTTYWFRVAAVNDNGTGSWLDTSAQTSPAAPTAVTATPATGTSFSTVTVSWSAPPGGATAYDLEYATSSTFAGATTLTGVTSPRQVTGLSGNTTYWFRVTARNTTGSGPASASTSALTAPAAPSAVTLTCAQGYNAWGTLVNSPLTDSCTATATVAAGTTVDGIVAGPGGYTRTFTTATYTAAGVPLANTADDPMLANARACNATGCGPYFIYLGVTSSAVPQPGAPSVTRGECFWFGYCFVSVSAAHAWTYEVEVSGGSGSGVMRCYDVQCAGDGIGDWPVAYDSTLGRYYTERSIGTTAARTFHITQSCGGLGGCSRDLLVPAGSWVRVAGTNGFLSGAPAGWPNSGWCVPPSSGSAPNPTTCRWSGSLYVAP